MTDDRSTLDRALDLLVFAPVGLALSARQVLPELIERGRREVAPQVATARLVGQLAFHQGQAQTSRVLREAQAQAEAVLTEVGFLPRREARDERPDPTTTTAAHQDRDEATPAAPPDAPTATTEDEVGPPVESLAIPGYDTLSASQVVPRLASLSGDELEAVRVYETAGRGRRTILHRVTQLQAR